MDDGLGVGEALNETGISGKGLVARGERFTFTICTKVVGFRLGHAAL